MKILKTTALAVSASLLIASFATGQSYFPSAAQDSDLPREGSREITFGGSGESDRNFDNGSLSLEGSYGYYTTDRVLLSARQTINNIGSRRNWSGSTVLAADYHFLQGPFRPFIGPNFGVRYGGKSVGDSFALGVQTGAKYYLKGSSFLFGRAGYSYTFDRPGDIDDAWDKGRWGYAFGVGLLF
ncbi:MAG: hypothetical protein JJU00_13120 [Opitutales bacterium]|nr:hypothetical protein [Opitutales bacterium]